mgnify:CR=1 FL=1
MQKYDEAKGEKEKNVVVMFSLWIKYIVEILPTQEKRKLKYFIVGYGILENLYYCGDPG